MKSISGRAKDTLRTYGGHSWENIPQLDGTLMRCEENWLERETKERTCKPDRVQTTVALPTISALSTET